MKALGHMELEASCVPEAPDQLMERMMSVAQYLVTNGAVISDGDTIGQDADEKIRVVRTKSLLGHPQHVMRLVYDNS